MTKERNISLGEYSACLGDWTECCCKWNVSQQSTPYMFYKILGKFYSVSTVPPSSLIPRPPRPAFVTQYKKWGEGLEGLILSHDECRCWRHVQSAHTWVCSSSFFLFSLSCKSDCYWIDRG